MLTSRDCVKNILSFLNAQKFATGVLTSDQTNVSDGDTVTVGTQVYTFKTALTTGNATPGEVLISTVDADHSLTNLAAAINGGAGAGTAFDSSTPVNTNVTSSAVASHALTLTSVAASGTYNAVATTETSSHLSFGATTLTGGVGGQATGLTFLGVTPVNSDPIDVGLYVELLGFLNIIAHGGTNPTLDVKMQFSHDKVVWVDSADAFTQVTTSDTLTFKRFTANFGRWVRFVFTFTGTTPMYKLDAVLMGKT